MIELFAQRKADALNLCEVGNEAVWRARRAAQRDLTLTRMAVYAAVFVAARCGGKPVRRVEAEGVGDFHFGRGLNRDFFACGALHQGMPISL